MVGPIAAVAAVAAAALANLGNLTNHHDEHGGSGAFVGCAVIALIVAVVLFGWAVPRWQGSAKASLVLAGLSVLSIGAFWAGLPLVVAPAAIVVALGADHRTTQHNVAIGIATLALLVGAVAALFG